MKGKIIIVKSAVVFGVLLPVIVCAAASANFGTTQERGGPVEFDATSTNYNFKAEIGQPAVGKSASANYSMYHGYGWDEEVVTSSVVTSTTAPSGNVAGIPLVSVPQTKPGTASVIQIDQQSVLVSWYSSLAGSSRVIFGESDLQSFGSPPNYGYPYSTQEFPDNSTYHAVVISGLKSGVLYYFRPVTKAGGNENVAEVLKMAPLFGQVLFYRTLNVPSYCPAVPAALEPPTNGSTKLIKPVLKQINTQDVRRSDPGTLQIVEVKKADKAVILRGNSGSMKKIKIRIY